jgi:hypothetical protein
MFVKFQEAFRNRQAYVATGRFPSTSIIVSEWSQEGLWKVAPIWFEVIHRNQIVGVPMIVVGSLRLNEENGWYRLLMGYFARMEIKDPGQRPTKEQAELYVEWGDHQNNTGHILAASWLISWIDERAKALAEDDRYRPDH